MKLGMYIMAREPVSTTYFLNPPISLCSICASLLSLLGKSLVATLPRQRIHTNDKKNVLRVSSDMRPI
jgi:hypothetical protein